MPMWGASIMLAPQSRNHMGKYISQEAIAELKAKILARPALYTINYGAPGVLPADWKVLERSLTEYSVPVEAQQKTYLAIIFCNYQTNSTTLVSINLGFRNNDEDFATNTSIHVKSDSSSMPVSGQEVAFYRLYQSDLSTVNLAVRLYGASSGSTTRLNGLRILFVEIPS